MSFPFSSSCFFYLRANFLPLTVLLPRDADKKHRGISPTISACDCECFCQTTPVGQCKRLRIICSCLARSASHCEQPAFHFCLSVHVLLLFMYFFFECVCVFFLMALHDHTQFYAVYIEWKTGRRYRSYGVYSFPLPLTSLLTQQAAR